MDRSNHIFISYRREDSADVTGRIHDRLSQHFGPEAIFTDVDSIPLGVDFKEYIDRQVGQCQILLAVIGKNWTQIKNEQGKVRLQVQNDYVRIEIESALKRNIPIIPLLVQGAGMPSETELPATLKKLIYRHGQPVRPNPDFHRDMDRLVKGLERQLTKAQEKSKIGEKEKSAPKIKQKHLVDVKNIYEKGRRKYEAEEYNEALELFMEAAKTGHSRAMTYIGVMYSRGYGVPQDYQKALTWYQKAAEGANDWAMYNIGYYYQNGYAVNKDYHKAMEWFQKAVEAGNIAGMTGIGVLYEYGHGVDQNYQKALNWYQKAANRGDGWAMHNIGYYYQHGYAVDKDYDKAMKWYQKAADAGNAAGTNGIGLLYENGQGVKKDLNLALEWYQKAAEGGDDWAMHNIGNFYEYGKAVDKDYDKAMEWYQKAADLGNEQAKKALERLSS
ncbi:toll/interleukin-1 receptor domain-containing protein [Fulvivirgaceae bacterium BMA12]|uniref:Toll/interleukin-1 receptor domain-containing protein n=1 Tax=Agaribacillus aureus TaxID=3051825 RepID=A0ABT8LLP4_9BACT|nr:toll/interleukin-1 receptor domain-containing protein [Fulvivirgaceae bacterium BMA12]